MNDFDLEPCADWRPDCQGKWDYDGRLFSISSRYWPASRWTDKHSATASIVLNHGKPNKYGFGDQIKLAEHEFEGDTEAEVKAQVEEWVKDICTRAFRLAIAGLKMTA
jgi:hypothetical protein